MTNDTGPTILLFEILQEKLDSSADLFKTASELYIKLWSVSFLKKEDLKERVELFMNKIMDTAEETYNQLDSLIGELINEIEEKKENSNGHE